MNKASHNKLGARARIPCILALVLFLLSLLPLLGGCALILPASTDSVSASSGKSSEEDDATSTREKSPILIEPIEGIASDFVKGVDISSIISLEQSGVKFYDKQGNEQDIFKTLSEAGVNYIRARVWHNPYDSNGNGYGGGNCDVEKAALIGKRAAAYNMKLLVDFHYSDFWADPQTQKAPKAWEDYDITQKKNAVYEYTLAGLNTIDSEGADVGMVQIGNEIDNGIAGETTTENICAVLKSASNAVRAFANRNDQDVKVAVHYGGGGDTTSMLQKAKMLYDYQISYDVFGVSYYPYHNDAPYATLTDVCKTVKAWYGKEVMVLESSYAYTVQEGDGFHNNVNNDSLIEGYGSTVQSQALMIRDIMAAAVKGGGRGFFYWEAAWIPVGPRTNKEQNALLWERYGSGWASSYAGEYDEGAGKYFGGSGWDNQALFDNNGKPLPSLNVFKYVDTGTTCETKVDYVKYMEVTFTVGDEIVMPTTAYAYYNNRTTRTDNVPLPITWLQKALDKIDNTIDGVYYIEGKVDGTSFWATVNVVYPNLLHNPSFEDADMSSWVIAYTGENPTYRQETPAESWDGNYNVGFWFGEQREFTLTQTLRNAAAGTYEAYLYMQGNGKPTPTEIYLFITVDGVEHKSSLITLSGWGGWQRADVEGVTVTAGQTVSVGVKVKGPQNLWGTIDSIKLSVR